MKKIFNILWIICLIIPYTLATEVAGWRKGNADDTIRILRAKNVSLREYVEERKFQMACLISEQEYNAAQEKAKLKAELVTLKSKQDVSSTVLPHLHSKDLTHKSGPNSTPTLSTYQLEFLQDWNNGQGRIGPKAWEALRGDNQSLAEAMAAALRFHQGNTLDIYCLEGEYITFRVDGKIQCKPHKIRR